MAKPPKSKIVTKKHLARLERERIQTRNLTIGAIVVIVLVIGVIGYGILYQNVLKARQPVAKVGNQSISSAQFDTQVQYQRFQLIQRYKSTAQLLSFFGSDPNSQSYFTSTLQQIRSQLDNTQSLGSAVLTQMIDDLIIRQEAAKRGITVTSAEVDEAMQAAFGYYPNGTPTPTLTPTIADTPTYSPTTLALVTLTPTPTITLTPTEAPPATEAPTATPGGPTQAPTEAATPTPSGPTATPEPLPTETPYTLEGYQGEVNNYLDLVKPYGFTMADLRYLFESQLYRDKLEAALTADLKPEQDQVWARHILVSTQADAEKIIQDLKAGQSWDALAATSSQDTSNKDSGGNLGWFGKGVMDPAFEEAAFSLPVGEISQPVQSQFGWHVIQVLGHQVRPLTAAEFDQLKLTTLQNWLTEQEKADNVKKYDYWTERVPVVPTLAPEDIVG